MILPIGVVRAGGHVGLLGAGSVGWRGLRGWWEVGGRLGTCGSIGEARLEIKAMRVSEVKLEL